jgi:hypothetical protein
MKRFFCVICKRIKRVRVLPSDVQHYDVIENPINRTGTCRFHSGSRVKSSVKSVRPSKTVQSTPAVQLSRKAARKIGAK